jgi:hypothetical protein
MKVVISKLWNLGYLTIKGSKRLAEIKGKNCYFFVSKFGERYIPIDEKDIKKDMFIEAFSVPNPNDYVDYTISPAYLTNDQCEERYRIYSEICLSHIVNRNDSDLVQLVEELGNECNTGGRPKIIEIPDDVEFEIQEPYDNCYCDEEIIVEKHREWR